MKFKYTNSNNETSYYEAESLTSELYSVLIKKDLEFLESIANGENSDFQETTFKDAAKDMLISFGLGKNKNAPTSTEENVVLFVTKKITLSENTDEVNLSTPKKIIRSKMITSKIRSFKQKNMELNFELAQ